MARPGRDEYAQLAVRCIDRMLMGAKPGDLAVEQTTRFHLVINFKTAKTLMLGTKELIQCFDVNVPAPPAPTAPTTP